MAQDQFINVTIDAGAAKKLDNSNHQHAASNGAAAAGDLTISWDSTKFTTINLLRTGLDAAVKRAMGQMK